MDKSVTVSMQVSSTRVGLFGADRLKLSPGRTDLSEAPAETDCHYAFPDRWSCSGLETVCGGGATAGANGLVCCSL